MRPPPLRNFNGLVPRYNPKFGALQRTCHGKVPNPPTDVDALSQLYQSCQRPADWNVRPLKEINDVRHLPIRFDRRPPNPKLAKLPEQQHKKLVIHKYWAGDFFCLDSELNQWHLWVITVEWEICKLWTASRPALTKSQPLTMSMRSPTTAHAFISNIPCK